MGDSLTRGKIDSWKLREQLIQAYLQYNEDSDSANSRLCKAIKEYKQTDKKEAFCDNLVGLCYSKGMGVQIDFKKAEKYFKSAIKLDKTFAPAQYNLNIYNTLIEISKMFDGNRKGNRAVAFLEYLNQHPKKLKQFKNKENKTEITEAINSISAYFTKNSKLCTLSVAMSIAKLYKVVEANLDAKKWRKTASSLNPKNKKASDSSFMSMSKNPPASTFRFATEVTGSTYKKPTLESGQEESHHREHHESHREQVQDSKNKGQDGQKYF